MHSIRMKAHRAASHVGEGQANYNPFARVRSRDSEPTDVENQFDRVRGTRGGGGISGRGTSEAAVSPTGASSSNTSPHRTSAAERTETEKEHEKDAPVPAGDEAVKQSTDISDTTAIGSTVTKRKKFKSIFRKEDEGDHVVPEAHEDEGLTIEERKKKAMKRKIPIGVQVRAVFFGSWINALLLFVPVGFALYYAHVGPVPVFVVNFIAIIPLAAILSYATEELAIRVGETLGGLLNATFGNAVELIVSIQALVKNEITIVKTSLIGSMLSNLLLVLGMSFFLGGVYRLEQFFNVTVAQTAASLLALCIASLIIPTVFHNMIAEDNVTEGDDQKNHSLSRGTAIILLFVYGCYLVFQLKSHVTMYNAPSQKVPKRKSSKIEEGSAVRGIAAIGAGTAAASGGGIHSEALVKNEEEEEEDDFEEPQLSVIGALITLAISTTLVAFCSEFMVSSIEGITETGKISTTFVGLILLPIVGNAAEHATAVTVAVKDKMDLSIGVAVGSSMQIALLVLPLIVVLGWIIGKDEMDLFFDTFQIATLFVSVLLVNYLIQDGKSHWLEGVLLMSSYLIIALAAWFYPNTVE